MSICAFVLHFLVFTVKHKKKLKHYLEIYGMVTVVLYRQHSSCGSPGGARSGSPQTRTMLSIVGEWERFHYAMERE